MVTTVLANTSIAKIRAALRGQVITPGDAEYETARRVWNGSIDRRPAVIIRCMDANDVQRAVEFGRQSNLEIAVRGGAHSIPGFSTCDGGLVIDLSPMKAVSVNPRDRSARAEPGVKLGGLIEATQAYGLGTTTGTASDTGIAGLTPGGGIGWLMGKHGLACDNVRSFELVTADGRLLRANANENADLYWGLRGGGGNFGIVTAFDYRLHPLGPILGGMVIHPLSRARAVLRFYRDFTREIPDELALTLAIFTTPDGEPVIGMQACYCGDGSQGALAQGALAQGALAQDALAQGERVIAPLRKFGPPLIDRIQPMPYAGLFAFYDAAFQPSYSYYIRGCSLPALSDSAIDALADAAEDRTSPHSQIHLVTFHGAAARVGAGETAFPFREEHYELMVAAVWEDDGQERHVQWVRQSYQTLQRFASQSTYVNFLTDEGMARVRAAYGPNYPRLVALKTKYDPENIFHLNQNIQPDASRD